MQRPAAAASGQPPSITKLSREDTITLATELVKPLADVNKNIQDNISIVNGKLQEVQKIDPDRTDVATLVKTSTTELLVEKLDRPQTVCGAIKCIGVTTSMSGKKVEDYKQICHETCFIKGVPTSVQNQEQLQDAMDRQTNDPTCLHCACSWKEHMHRRYKTIEKEQEVEDASIVEMIKTTSNNTELVKVITESLKGKIEILEGEQKIVTQVSAQVATYLEQNNKSAGIDVTSGYLDHQIDVQESLVTHGNSRDLLELMKTTRTRYAEELQLLSSTGQVVITPENILESVKKLYNLPATGDQIRRTIEAATSDDISGRIDSVEAGISALNLVSTQTDSLTQNPASSKLKLPTIITESQ